MSQRIWWYLRILAVNLGILDSTIYYVSKLYGDDENDGRSKITAFATYDRAQGMLDYRKDDIILIQGLSGKWR